MYAYVFTDSAAVLSLITKIVNKMPNPGVTKVKIEDNINSLLKGAAKNSVFFIDWDAEHILPDSLVKQIKTPLRLTDIPIIIITSKNNEASISDESKKLVSAILNKPLNPEELIIAIQKATRPVGATSSVDVSFVNPFIAATMSVFDTMAHTKITRKDLFLKHDYRMFGDVSGVMGLVGTASGSVVLSLPQRTACKVVANMLGEAPPDKVTETVKDGVGEIVNIISGQAKSALAQTKHHFTLSIPSVVYGPGHEIMHKKGSPCIVVIFDAEGDLFALQVCLASEMA